MATDYIATIAYVGNEPILSVRATHLRYLKTFMRSVRATGSIEIQVKKPEGLRVRAILMTLSRQDRQHQFTLLIERWDGDVLVGSVDATTDAIRNALVDLLNIARSSRPRTGRSPRPSGEAVESAIPTKPAKPAQPAPERARPTPPSPKPNPFSATTDSSTILAAIPDTPNTPPASKEAAELLVRPPSQPFVRTPTGSSRWRIDAKSISKSSKKEDGQPGLISSSARFNAAARVRELRELYKQMSWDELNRIQEPYEFQCPSLVGYDAVSLTEVLKLNAKEQRFIENLLTGDQSLRDIYTMTNLSRRETCGLMLALLGAEVVKFTERPLEELQKRSLAEATANRHLAIDSATYFGFLDLHWSANGEEINAAADKIIAQLGPAANGVLGPEWTEKAREAIKHTRKVKAALATTGERRLYRLTFLEQFNVVQSIQLFATQLEWAIYREDRQAIQQLTTRIEELNPQGAGGIIDRARSRAADRQPDEGPPSDM